MPEMTRQAWHPFDVITHVLAERLRGREPSDQLRTIVRSRSSDWESIVGHASTQFVLPALAAAHRDLGLNDLLEPELGRFLLAVHTANLERNRALCNQLAQVASTLNRIGIEPVLLKGAIRLVDGLYPDLGWRLMVDLDILVPEAEFMRAVGALQGTGYVAIRAVDPTGKDAKLWRRGFCVEVHKELFWTTRRRQLLCGAEVITSSQPATLQGARVRLPSIEHQMTHLIGHSQLGHFNYVYGRIALRDRLEAAVLLRRRPAQIDWDAVHARFAVPGYRRPLQVFLLALHDGGLCALPTGSRFDTLKTLQARRIALQARSHALTRMSLFVGWYVVLFQLHVIDHDAGWGHVLQSLKRFVRHREARRRLAKILAQAGPHLW